MLLVTSALAHVYIPSSHRRGKRNSCGNRTNGSQIQPVGGWAVEHCCPKYSTTSSSATPTLPPPYSDPDKDVGTRVGGHRSAVTLFVIQQQYRCSNPGKMDQQPPRLSIQSKSRTLQQNGATSNAGLAYCYQRSLSGKINCKKHRCTLSGFGYRAFHPVYKIRKFHAGLDFPAQVGTAIQASGEGVVVENGWHSGYVVATATVTCETL